MLYIFAYFGPETTLPVVSGIMAVVGFAIMMGRNTFSILGRWGREAVGRLTGRSVRSKVVGQPPRKISDLIVSEPNSPTAPALDREAAPQH